MEPVEAVGAEGVVCVVAGDKKTTLYALADRVEQAVVTATVRIPIFDPRLRRGRDRRPAHYACGRDGVDARCRPRTGADESLSGYDRETITRLGETDSADVVLVKADGARSRLLKAPNEREPRIPAGTDVVVPVVSASAVGKPLESETVHRPERVAALTGLLSGEEIRPVDVANVLVSEEGGRKPVPEGATVVPLINVVDDELERVDREIGRDVLARTDVPRVVLARMIASEPVVAVLD